MFLYIVTMLNLATASFSIGNLSADIESKYGAGENIQGWINISLQNEPADSILAGNFKGSIKILDLLKANNNQFTCETEDCITAYNSQNPQTSKNFNLNFMETKLIGIQFSGEKVRNIQEINFSISSNAQSSCSPQIKIDLGDDGEIDFINTAASNELCDMKNYGCFVNSGVFDEYNLGTTPYCQKINISESPGLYIGAFVKKGAGNPLIKMKLLDESGSEEGFCQLSFPLNEGEFSCEINLSNALPKSYYVCIVADQTTTFKIRGNRNPVNRCGFYGADINNFEGAYSIFVQQKKFAPAGSFVIADTLSSSISEKIYSFLDKKYRFDSTGYNCSNTCTFPISIVSQTNQQVNLLSLNLEYDKSSGKVSENNFYDASKNSPRLNSVFQKIDLARSNISVSDSIGNNTLVLKLGGQQILSQNISIENTPKILYLFPLKTAVNFPTDFIVGVNNRSRTIVRYEWDFGDTKKENTQTNKATHTYNETKNYTLKVAVVDDKSFISTKSFQIEVGSAKEKVNETLISEKEKLGRLKTQIESMPIAFKDNFYDALNLTNAEEELKRIERGYNQDPSEGNYFRLLQDLLAINLPNSVNLTEEADNIFFVPQETAINIDYISDIAGGSADTDKEDVLKWTSENVDLKIDYKEYSSVYNDKLEKLIKTFVLNVKPKTNYSYDTYLFFDGLEGLKFEGDVDYKLKTGEDLIYVLLDSGEKSITFSTSSDVDFTDLSVYISPSLNNLPLNNTEQELVCNQDKICNENETWINCSDCKPIWIYILAVLILLIIFIIGYIIIYRWYKKNYEGTLFKNQNDLYNIIHYIHNLKLKGIGEEDIIRNLKRSGWNSEQISYVMKKYSGKRTGLWHPFER
ncbi:MAG: PKD domain-containing protein [Nanoarchaeota archaeon]